MSPIFFDSKEVRSSDERENDHLVSLKKLIENAKTITLHSDRLKNEISTLTDLQKIDVFRKSDLIEIQKKNLPFGNLNFKELSEFSHIYRSPGPIYDLDGYGKNWWRFARALNAAGFNDKDIVQNCFSYHFTPAGMMFDEAAKLLKCTIFPAGGENSDMQAEIMSEINTTGYVGIPDFLKIIIEKAEINNLPINYLKKALFSGGPLFPDVAEYFKSKNIDFYQCYGTADLGLIAYEADIDDGMVVDEDIILEIVKPGTNERVPNGEVGEVIVTVLNNYELPIIRFATGDLSTIIEGQSKTGRTNIRIKGWMGRADQTTKVRGMFVQPSQIAKIIDNLFTNKPKAKLLVSRENNRDNLKLLIEHVSNENDKIALNEKVVDEMKKILNLNGIVEFVNLGSLPNDGKVIDDVRDFGD